ncbi:unnamed protein product [Miscanthus lutarioriparius]|uniref:Uncharacterized protein n=1 Tax=Miscanthus lutarioriparius TaxID=422564 RepID=A0A811NJM9_9POAL|nr:unnamed protein product [Miscanthus lutarioriparius]
MGPDQKALLAELDKRFAAQDKRFDGLERKLDSTAAKLDSMAASSSTRLDALESATKVFDEWRPGVDGVIDDLRLEVTKLATLKLEVGKISKYMERSMVDGPSATPRVIATAPATKSASAPASPYASLRDAKPVVTPHFRSAGFGDILAAPRPSAGYAAPRPSGHRVDIMNREGAFGVVTTLIPPPGLDWLASFSPMQVHWAQKWISIPYEGATAILIGDSADLPVGSVILLCLVQHDESS